MRLHRSKAATLMKLIMHYFNHLQTQLSTGGLLNSICESCSSSITYPTSSALHLDVMIRRLGKGSNLDGVSHLNNSISSTFSSRLLCINRETYQIKQLLWYEWRLVAAILAASHCIFKWSWNKKCIARGEEIRVMFEWVDKRRWRDCLVETRVL